MATTWVALLRAVNVGGHNKVPMADLRTVLEALGFDDVRTLLQSGNAVFSTAKGSAATLEKKISEAIATEFDVHVPVLVRSAADIAKVVKANPFAGAGAEPKQLHVAFLSAKPAARKLAAIDAAARTPDEFEAGDRVIYLRLPNGVGGTVLPNWDRVLGVAATVRNWNTVNKLNDMAAGRT